MCSPVRLVQRAQGGFCLHFPRGPWKEPVSQMAPYTRGAHLIQMNMKAQCGHGGGGEGGSLGGKGEAEWKARRAAEGLS